MISKIETWKTMFKVTNGIGTWKIETDYREYGKRTTDNKNITVCKATSGMPGLDRWLWSQ